jgi:hypothetical protein
MRGWPSSSRVIRQTVNDPDPTTVALVAALDRGVGRGMAAHAGTIIAGEPSSMHYKFTGYLRARVGVPTQAGVTSLLRRPDTLLPATSGPVVSPPARTVADSLAASSPGGER